MAARPDLKPSSPWITRRLAVAAGLAVGLAHPPFGLLPGLLGYALFLRLADTEGPRPLRSAFFRGWLAGVGYFAIGVWWITEAFLVDAAAPSPTADHPCANTPSPHAGSSEVWGPAPPGSAAQCCPMPDCVASSCAQ